MDNISEHQSNTNLNKYNKINKLCQNQMKQKYLKLKDS